MALFEQSPSRSGSRFGKLSSNMFFTRNTAKPKRVRHIEGLNGALICNVNDDPSVVRSTSSSSLDFSKTNLPSFEPSRRVERLLPPMGFWNTYGVVQNTDRWRQELASLAFASGIGVEKDEHKSNNRPSTTANQQTGSRSGARYSMRTGRFNEGTSKSRGRTGSKHGTGYPDLLFNVTENERDMWMLQVLCQLLGTSNLEDVQSWLVSATHAEKEQARVMINSALQGLKESERSTTMNSNDLSPQQQSIDFNSLTDFVEKQKHEEKQASQKYMKETLTRPLSTLQSIDEEKLMNSNNNHLTTYKNSFPNYNRRSMSSFDITNNKIDEQIERTQFNDDDDDDDDDEQERPRSASLIKNTKIQKPIKRSVSTYEKKHHIDSLQIEDVDNHNHNENEEEQQQQPPKEIILPPIKSSNPNDNASEKTRKIRELERKLSRQEEEAKKQLNELQSKQSRLENAIKLLVKQTSSYGKRRSQNVNDEKENSDEKNDRVHHQGHLSKNQPRRSYSGIWKPDASTIHRLQGN